MAVRVFIELWPGGFARNRKLLGGVQIANNLTGTEERGNYDVKFFGARGRRLKRTAQVVYFPRKKLTALHLLARALKNAGYCDWDAGER